MWGNCLWSPCALTSTPHLLYLWAALWAPCGDDAGAHLHPIRQRAGARSHRAAHACPACAATFAAARSPGRQLPLLTGCMTVVCVWWWKVVRLCCTKAFYDSKEGTPICTLVRPAWRTLIKSREPPECRCDLWVPKAVCELLGQGGGAAGVLKHGRQGPGPAPQKRACALPPRERTPAVPPCEKSVTSGTFGRIPPTSHPRTHSSTMKHVL